ncbi:MAG TPA: TIR domain-containing protein, partial [Pyrinomonadaceae bacterium]
MTNPASYEYDIFLSHNHKDQEWTARLAERLEQEDWQGRKIRVFFSPWDIIPGQSIPLEIERALPKSRKVGLIMSPEAIDSAWVELERLVTTHIAVTAREARLIPLLRRACEIPALVQHLLYINFTEDDQFEESYQRLLSVIKDEPTPRRARKAASVPVSLPASIPRPPAVGFVARRDTKGRDIVEVLKGELAPEKNQLLVLWGAGGVGKTTLAVEAVKTLSDVFEQRIVWASPELRADLTLATLLDEIATQLGRADLRPLAFEPKEEQVRALLAEAHALIILDNFETVTTAEQTRCAEWLAKRAPCPALITTRQRIVGAHNVSIHAMTPGEASEFVERWIEREAHSPHAFEGLERELIIEAAGRNPLVLQWVLARVDLAGEPEEVLNELMQGAGDAAQRVFDSSFKLPQLGDDGRDVLLALSLFVPDASREALAEAAGFETGERKRFNEATMRLSSLWMVEATQGNKRLKIEGLTRELTRSHFSKDDRADEFRRRFVAHFLGYAQAHAETTPEDFAALEAEKDNILSAMDVAFGLHDWLSVTQLMDSVDGLLRMRGYWDEAIRRGEQALKAAQTLPDEAAVARFAHNTAITLQNRGEIEEARQLYNESLEIKKRLGNQSGIAISLHQLAVLAQAQGELEEARRLYGESLEIKKRLGNQSGIATTL